MVRAPLGKIALVIDDAGYDLERLAPFLELEGAVTIAVLPGLEHSREAARRAREAGKPVFLHSPMEPLGDENPGPGAIMAGMSAQDVRAALERQLAEVGDVAGINNHMGSRATADAATVQGVLSFTMSRGLVFLDSRTTASSVVAREAATLGAPAVARDVFLDNDAGAQAFGRQLEEAKSIARSRGQAVAIGHVQSDGLAAFLAEALPGLARDGYLLYGVGELARSGAAGGGR